MKTYKDSYLYKNKTRKLNSDENKNTKVLSDFIMTSNRIDKNSNAFKGILEDIKRQQTSSIVLTILLLDQVQLCIGNYELPRAFKVIEAYDIRYDKKPKVFIDVTGIMEYRNGFYICKKVDVLITYIYNALIYLLYRHASARLMNNAEITMSGTNCYTYLFCYIIDYLRIIGYAENKNKIAYVIALFFLHNHMGKDLDQYTKNIAAKTANIPLTNIGPFDLYLNEIDFTDINTFITTMAAVFSLKGLTTEVVISKWVFLLGTGTQYASELFTNFAMLMTSAYAGSYIVNQKQIDRTCGTEMVKFNNAIKRLGVETFERGNFREAYYEAKNSDVHSKETSELKEALELRNYKPYKITGNEFKSIDEALVFANAIKKFYQDSRQYNSIQKEILKCINAVTPVMENYVSTGSNVYEEGALFKFMSVYKNVFNGKELQTIKDLIDKNIRIYQGIAEEFEEIEDRKRCARCVSELRDVKNNL